MGCHTWYEKLVTNDPKKVEESIKAVISESQYWNWYELTSLEELLESDEEWMEEIVDYVYDNIDLIKVNGVWGIYRDAGKYCTNEPRIAGYPECVITSAEEMFKAMETGLIGWKGNHCHFYWDENRDKPIRDNITEFFNEHPDGIIRFG
jgi:hypothetical protein